jgi:hypothetical protein
LSSGHAGDLSPQARLCREPGRAQSRTAGHKQALQSLLRTSDQALTDPFFTDMPATSRTVRGASGMYLEKIPPMDDWLRSVVAPLKRRHRLGQSTEQAALERAATRSARGLGRTSRQKPLLRRGTDNVSGAR